MKNHLTFPRIIAVILDNKKRDYPMNMLIRDLFSLSLPENASDPDAKTADNTMFSKWCSGARTIPLYVLDDYDSEAGRTQMRSDMENHLLPGLVNIPNARQEIEALITNSIPVIGEEKAAELLSNKDNATFFAEAVLYAVFCDHKIKEHHSPDLSDLLISSRLPRAVQTFTGREELLKLCASRLEDGSPLFICGIAGIGKSEFAKAFAAKYRRQYANIVYLFYTGDLKRMIASMKMEDDPADADEGALFSRHYAFLQRCREDTLIILDNFDVYPEYDPFFRELSENSFRLLVTTRCHLPRRNTLTIDELDADHALFPLFCELCPSAKRAIDMPDGELAQTIREIIAVVHRHTLTVALAALTLSASGIEPATLLRELRSCTLNPPSGESVEVYKDGTYSDGLMREHLKRLLRLGNLSEPEKHILQSFALMPDTGAYKHYFKEWLNLPNLSDVQKLVRYGYVQDDEENERFLLHPLIRDVIATEIPPTYTACRELMEELERIALVQGKEFYRADEIIQTMISAAERVINNEPASYLLYLQDIYSYLDKYSINDYLPKLTARIEYVMQEHHLDSACDRALLLNYKARSEYNAGDYGKAVKRFRRAVTILEKIPSDQLDERGTALLSNSYSNLAMALYSDNKTHEATAIMQKAVETRAGYGSKNLIESHDTINQMQMIVRLYIKSRQIGAAEEQL
ncbi:MAG: tetratricopeptide repeat protein, partial [Lachnospiraceae bacterium]|nr:tetratricopeptide repeat protein [Lachnospiraceae bacterium]